MVRGGQREGAGRKSTWESGAKFEDTVLIRIPKHIRNDLLAIAHRLDIGGIFDNETKSNSEILELQTRIEELENDNQNLHQSIQSRQLDFDSQLKLLQDKILILQEEKQQLNKELEMTKLELVAKSNELQLQTKILQEQEKIKRGKLVTKSEKPVQLEIPNTGLAFIPLDDVSLAKRYGTISLYLKEDRKKGINKYIPPDSSKDFGIVEWDFSCEDDKYHPVFLPAN